MESNKCLIYIVAIGMDVKEHSEKAWNWYCKKHGYDFEVITEPSRKDMAPHWERYTVFEKFPNYDQYMYVDADAMVSWRAPDFFEKTHTQYDCIDAVKDIGSLEWTYNSMLGYQDMFPDIKFNWWEYVTTGVLRFNSLGIDSFFNKILEFHEENKEELNKRQYNTLKKGFDQTPFNYLARQHHISIKTLPEPYSLGHLHKKDIFNNGMFVNIPSYIWQFNGIPKEQLSYIMEQLWNHVKEQYQ